MKLKSLKEKILYNIHYFSWKYYIINNISFT